MKITTRIIKDLDNRRMVELRNQFVGRHTEVKVGFPSSAEEDGVKVATIAAAHEYGSPSNNIPERPFLRVALRANAKKYVEFNRLNLLKIIQKRMKVEQALALLGEMAKSDVQVQIRTGSYKPLKAATIRRKKSSKPLIDSGQMVQSVSYVIGDENA